MFDSLAVGKVSDRRRLTPGTLIPGGVSTAPYRIAKLHGPFACCIDGPFTLPFQPKETDRNPTLGPVVAVIEKKLRLTVVLPVLASVRAAYISLVATTSGGPAAKRLTRHSDYRTTEAYVLIEDDVLRQAVNRVAQRPALAVVKSASGQTRIQESHTTVASTTGKSSNSLI